jgi:hypothetical protein
VSEAAIKARITPPNLADAREYVPVLGVPILDIHYRDAVDESGKQITTFCGLADLENLCKNSQSLADRGDYAVVRVGHINPQLPNHKERDQPEIIGYIPKFYMGERDDQAVILADIYVERKHAGDLQKYPRRSPEIFGKCHPDGYIDAVALLNRPPERSLGLVTYSKFEPVYHYEKESPGVKTMLEDADFAKMAECFKSALREVFDLDNEVPAGTTEDTPNGEQMMDDGAAPKSDESGPALEAMADGGGAGCGAMGGSGGGAGGTYPAGTSVSTPGVVEEEKKKKEHELMQSSSNLELSELRGEFEMFKKGATEAFKNAADRIRSLESDSAAKDAIIRNARRKEQLSALAGRGVKLDVNEELEFYSKRDDAEFAAGLSQMAKRYTRDVKNLPFIPPAPFSSLELPDRNPEMFSKDRLTDHEKSLGIKLLETYAKSHPSIPRTELQRTYLADIDYRKKLAANAVA